jgi:hypothetical protein
MMTSQLREFLVALGSFAVVMVVYFAAVFLLNGFRPPDTALAKEVKSIVWALQEYRAARGAYPVLIPQDALITDLKKEMAKEGFLRPEGGELRGPDPEARYFSDGYKFGLLFHGERRDDNRSGTCLIEFGARGLGFWGQPPKCEL